MRVENGELVEGRELRVESSQGGRERERVAVLWLCGESGD